MPIIPFNQAQVNLKRKEPRASWLVALFAVVLVGCIAGLVIAGQRTALWRKQSPQQGQIDSLVRQISSLTRSDLIVFPDDRVWYARGIRGGSMEVVGWIGDDARSEDIHSFDISNGDFSIVRQSDPSWAKKRDDYFKQ